MLAANFVKRGYNVIINGYIDAPAWNSLESHVTISSKFVLLPELETVIARDAGRSSEYVMGSEPVAQHHNIFSNDGFYESFTKLDTTHHTVDATAKNIMDALSSSLLR